MECVRAVVADQHQQQHLPASGRAIAEGRRGDDSGVGGAGAGAAMGSSDDASSSKLWDRVAAEDRRIGSEECLKLWMEMEARCGDGRGGGGLVETLKAVVDEMVPSSDQQQPECDGGVQGGGADVNDGSITMRLGGGGSGGVEETSNSREKDEWSPAEAIALLEAYEERFGDGRTGNLKAREWEEVAAAVNRRRHLDGKEEGGGGVGVAKKSLKQCKRKVYALRRWYKTVVGKQMSFRQDGYEHTLLCVLERIMAPSSACRAGIPGGIDAGERLSEPHLPSVFDEEEDKEELIQATRAALRPTERGEEGCLGRVASMQSGKRSALPGGGGGKRRRVGPATSQGMTNSNCEDGNVSNKKSCSSSCGATAHSDEVVSALNSFAKVLAKVEQTKMGIMKDLERRRAELQLKLTSVECFGQDQADMSLPPSMFSLL